MPPRDNIQPEQVRAYYAPESRSVSILDVEEDTHAGPWLCATEHCRIPLTYKQGYLRKRPVSGGQVPVRPTWVRAHQDILHAPDCEARRGKPAQGRYNERLGLNVRTEDCVLIQFGDRTKIDRELPEVHKGGGGTTVYAGRAGNLMNLLRMFNSVGGHEGMRKFFFIHDGITYRWDEIAYQATSEGYQRLCDSFGSLFHAPGSRPWIIWGSVRSHGPTNNQKRNEITLYPADRGVTNSLRVSAFYDKSSEELKSAFQKLQPGKNAVILLSGLSLPKMFTGVMGSLVNSSDAVVSTSRQEV